MWRERDGYIGCTSVRPQPTILHMTSFLSSTLSFEHELSAIPNSAWSTFYPDQSGLFLQVPFLENQSCSRKRQPLWRRCSLINYTSHLSTHQCSRISTKINYKPSLHRSDIKKHRKNCECCHHHSLFKGHNVNVNTIVLKCQKCNQCHKCQVSGFEDVF